jgi:uncharacterized protein YjbJ (UPF0337 family)
MNRDRIKGKAKDVLGRAERQVGEWTGDNKSQGEGMGKQIEGKAQNAWGKVKDAGSDLKRDLDRNLHGTDRDRDRDSDIERGEQDRGTGRNRRAA